MSGDGSKPTGLEVAGGQLIAARKAMRVAVTVGILVFVAIMVFLSTHQQEFPKLAEFAIVSAGLPAAGATLLIAVVAGRMIHGPGDRAVGGSAGIRRVESLSVPRVAGLTSPSDADVLSGGPWNPDGKGTIHTITVGGMLSVTPPRPASPPVPGALVVFAEGLIFLPAVDSQALGVLKGVARPLLKLAKSHLPILDTLGEAGLDDLLKDEEIQIPDWLRQSVLRPGHFVVPFVEMIGLEGVSHVVDPLLGTKERALVITRELADGERRSYRVRLDDPSGWLVTLMVARFRRELDAVIRERFLVPRMAEILDGLTAKYREIYGDRLGGHMVEVLTEAFTRANASYEALPESERLPGLRDAFTPALPSYHAIPEVVAVYPPMFESGGAASEPPR